MQSDFTKVNEKNLIPSLDGRLPVKDRLHDGFSSSLNGIADSNSSTNTNTCTRNKCHATLSQLHEGRCFSCKDITVSAFKV